MSKRTFRPKSLPSRPSYPARRRLLAVGAAAALTSLSACGPLFVTDGDAAMPEVDAGLDAAFEPGGVAPLPDAGEPDAGPDAGIETAGVPNLPDGGE